MFNRKVAPTIQDKNNKIIKLVAENPLKFLTKVIIRLRWLNTELP